MPAGGAYQRRFALGTRSVADLIAPAAFEVGRDHLRLDAQYARIAVGRDYSDVPPVRGAYAGPRGFDPDVAVSILNDQQQ